MMRKSRETDTEQERPLRGDVPLHRSYGVKRRIYPIWEAIKTNIARIVGGIILGGFAVIVLIAATFFFLYFQELWIKLLVALLLCGIVLIRLTRTLRKRIKFVRKLKKLCKNKQYQLIFHRKLFSSFRWSEETPDLTLKTKNVRYEIRYLTVKKYRSILSFENKEEITLKKVQLESRFNLIFDFQSKPKLFRTDRLTDPRESDSQTTTIIRGILVNPVCQEMRYKGRDGGMVATGNGAEIFGYTVFTGSGFLEVIQRNDDRLRYLKGNRE